MNMIICMNKEGYFFFFQFPFLGCSDLCVFRKFIYCPTYCFGYDPTGLLGVESHFLEFF